MASEWNTPTQGQSYSVNVGSSVNVRLSGYYGDSRYYGRLRLTANNTNVKFSNNTQTINTDNIFSKDEFDFIISVTGVTAGSSTITIVFEKSDFEIDWEEISRRTITINVSAGKTDPTYTAPTWATSLTYTGTAQELLLDGGTVSGGQMQYGLGANASTAPSSWSYNYRAVTGTNVGFYYVWYKILGDSTHNDLGPFFLRRVDINKGEQTFTFASPLNTIVGEQASELASGIFTGTWTVTPQTEGIITAAMHNDALFITGVTVGTTELNITCSGDDNYNARTVTIVCNVTIGNKVYVNGHWYYAVYFDATNTRKTITNIVKGTGT